MKSKKLISLLCAAAMTTSAFAGLVTTASAEGELLTLTDFTTADVGAANGTGTGKWNYSNSKQIVTVEKDEMGTYLQSTITAGEGSTYNTTYTLPTPITAKNYVIEYDTSIHKSNGMNRYGRMNQVAFTSSNAAMDPREYGISGNSSTSGTGAVYSSGIASSLTSNYNINGLWVNSYATSASDALLTQDDAISVGNDEWVRVQAVIDTETDTATVTVINAAGEKFVENEVYKADADTLNAIHLIPGRGDASVTGQGIVCIDNVHIYEGSAKTLTTEGLRGEAAIATPIPDPETVSGSSPTLIAPDTAENTFEASFNSSTYGDKFMSLGTEEQEPIEVVDGVNVSIGSRSQGGDGSTYASVVNTASGDKALKVAGAGFATQLRGPIISLEDDLDIIAGSGTTSVMAFSVYLSKIDALKDAPRFWLLDNTTNVDGGSVARDVLAVFTSGDIKNEEDSPIYASGSRNIGVQITEGEWHTVVVAVSEDSYRVFVDGQYKDASGNLTPAIVSKVGVGTGEGSMNEVTHLPLIAIENAKDGSSAYSQMLVDNILTYTFTGDVKAERLPAVGEAPTPAPPTATPQPKHNVTVTYDGKDKATVSTTETEAFDAVMAIAKYSSEGVLLSVDTKDVKGISSAAGVEVQVGAMNNGDQLLVWNSLEDMIPYGSLVITNGGTQPVAITGTVKVEGTPKVGETLTAEVADLNEGATAKYEWQANTGADGAYEKITGATAATFEVTEDLVGKTIKVVVTADGYTGSIVSAATAAVEAADEEQVAITGTVTVSGTAKVGETLTAVVSGLNEGATAKYEWQANTGADGAYEKIADATAETFVVTEDLVGKTIKVVVTAAGYEGLIESGATEAVEAADEEPVAAPTVETATLHDTTVGGVPDNELYTAGSYKVKTTDETGYTNVAIAAENLKKHKNGDSPANVGYWVGAAITAPEGKTIDGYYFSKDKYVADKPDFTNTEEDDKETIEFYTNVGAKDQKIWAAVKLSDGRVYVYKLDTTGVKVFEEAIPYDENTVTFDEEGDSAIFVDLSRVTSSIETSTTATANTTKMNRVATGTGGPSGARYDKYSDAYKATGDNVEVSFDFTVPKRDAYVSVRGTSADTSDRNNDATERIFTIGCESSFTLKIWGADTTAIEVANTSADTNWYHVEAVVNNTAKTTSIKVYNYKANNNYENETPLYENAALGFRDNSVTGVVGMDYFSPTNNAIMELDNVKIYDATYVAPMDVTVTAPDKGDGTLKVDKTQVKAEDVITITAAPVAGKKVTAVKVNGEAVTYNDGYKYTVTGEEDAIVVTAEFARADAAIVEVAGASSVQQGETAQYTATIKDEAGTVLTGDITWTVEGAQDTSNTKIENGLLTVGEAETASTLTVKATTKKDVANEEDETKVEGIATVTVATEAVYNVTKGTGINGTFTVSATQATEGTEITVEPSPAEGYRVKEVSYVKTEGGEEPQIVNDDGGYKFKVPAYNVTVNVEFEAIEYNITNNNSSADEHGNSVAIKVNGENATTATIGQTVTIEPTVAKGYKVSSVEVKETVGNDPVALTGYTFTMPAGDVTVTVTFVKWDGVYSSITFDNDADLTALGTWSDKTGRSTTNTISDGAFKMSIADDNKRSKGYSTMETPIDFSDSTNATISFDMIMNPMGNASKPTVSEITIGNSDHYALFAIRADSENTAAGFSVYAGGKVNNNVSSGSDAGSIGTSKNNWGSNEYVWNISNASGPEMTVLQKADESVLSFAKGTIYNVVLSISGDTMTVTVTDSTNGENTATAELNIAGLTKDIKHFVGFLDQGSSAGSGSYITVDNFKVVDTDVYSAE